jgi:hypothetical protein
VKLLSVLLLAACSAGPKATTGRIEGTVVAPQVAEMPDEKRSGPFCAQTHGKAQPAVLVRVEGTVASATGNAVLEERSCELVPRLVVSTNQPIEIKNSDPVLHAALGTQVPNAPATVTNLPTGMHEVRCDMHPWERAFIYVGPELAAVGSQFTVDNVSLGRHTLIVWHELLGEKRVEIVVAAGQTTKVDVRY